MEEKILKLIESYKAREALMTKVIIELDKNKDSYKENELKLAKNTRLFWRTVIKDLENLIR